jgi:hypothetical protein
MLAWKRNPSGLIGFGLLSLLAGTAWQVISVVLVALFYKGSAMAPMDMIKDDAWRFGITQQETLDHFPS